MKVYIHVYIYTYKGVTVHEIFVQYIPVVHGLAVNTRCTWIGSIYPLYMDWQYIRVVHGLAVYTRCTWIGRVVAGHARLTEGSGAWLFSFPE